MRPDGQPRDLLERGLHQTCKAERAAGELALDERARTFDTWGLPFFFTAAMLFINIHHYFIDSVAWRLNDAPVRQYLLGD